MPKTDNHKKNQQQEPNRTKKKDQRKKGPGREAVQMEKPFGLKCQRFATPCRVTQEQEGHMKRPTCGPILAYVFRCSGGGSVEPPLCGRTGSNAQCRSSRSIGRRWTWQLGQQRATRVACLATDTSCCAEDKFCGACSVSHLL